jgi:hypothetical protein
MIKKCVSFQIWLCERYTRGFQGNLRTSSLKNCKNWCYSHLFMSIRHVQLIIKTRNRVFWTLKALYQHSIRISGWLLIQRSLGYHFLHAPHGFKLYLVYLLKVEHVECPSRTPSNTAIHKYGIQKSVMQKDITICNVCNELLDRKLCDFFFLLLFVVLVCVNQNRPDANLLLLCTFLEHML